jgi:hypothetical protein
MLSLVRRPDSKRAASELLELYNGKIAKGWMPTNRAG